MRKSFNLIIIIMGLLITVMIIIITNCKVNNMFQPQWLTNSFTYHFTNENQLDQMPFQIVYHLYDNFTLSNH